MWKLLLHRMTLFKLLLFLNVVGCGGWFFWVFPDDNATGVIFFFPISLLISGASALIGWLLGWATGSLLGRKQEGQWIGAAICSVLATVIWWMYLFVTGYV